MGRPKALPDTAGFRTGPGHGTRAAKMARWLMYPPERGRELRLVYKDPDGNEQVLQSWLRDVVTPEDTPAQIEDAISDHVEDMDRHCRGTIVWVDDAAKIVTSKPWQANPQSGDDGRFSGDPQSIISQQQRHNEVLVQYMVRNNSLVFEQMNRLLEAFAEKFEVESQVSDTREEEIQLLREELEAMRAENADKKDPNLERVMNILEGTVAQQLAKRPPNGSRSGS